MVRSDPDQVVFVVHGKAWEDGNASGREMWRFTAFTASKTPLVYKILKSLLGNSIVRMLRSSSCAVDFF